MLAGGCTAYQYEPAPLDLGETRQDFSQRSLGDAGFREFMKKYGYDTEQWPEKTWDLHALTLAGYYFNPDLQVALARHRKSLVNEEVAGLYPNPGIELPLEHHSDTSDGVSPWLIGIVLDLVYERRAKREARVEQARAESDVSRVEILESAWRIYRSVRRAWLEYYVALSTRDFLQEKLGVVEEIVSILTRSFELGETSEFEINSMRLELQKVRLELVNQEVQINEALHRLAAEIGVPVTAVRKLELDFAGMEKYLESRQLDDGKLQEMALTHRLDMQHALLEYAAFEAALKLEIEKQYPDITLSPGFIFDQNDNIWQLGASWVLPLLHPHNEKGIRLALADRDVKRTEITSLQAGIINEIKLADSRLESTSNALGEAELLLQEAQERNGQIQNQYKLGQIDDLALLRNRLEMLAIEGALVDIELNVINAAFNYEDVIQYPLLDVPGYRLQKETETMNTSGVENEIR